MTNRKHQRSLPLVNLPRKIQVTLFLIREELKSRKLFQALHEAGLDDCYFQPHLDSLILQQLGMDDINDEAFVVYDKIMDKRSRKITADYHSVLKQAFKAYRELINERRKP